MKNLDWSSLGFGGPHTLDGIYLAGNNGTCILIYRHRH